MTKTTAFCPQCGHLTNHTPGRKCPLCNRGSLEARPTPDCETAPAKGASANRSTNTQVCVWCQVWFCPKLPYQAHCSDACFEADSSPID